MGGDARGSRAEDRSAPSGVYRRGCAGLRAGEEADLTEADLTEADGSEARPGREFHIDLRLAGLERAVSAHVLDGPAPAIVDPGPGSTLASLKAGLAASGLTAGDVRYVLVTHAHLDHAGGVGHLVRDNPHLEVVAHEDAAVHLADPARLVASTRRTFGARHDELWGETLPVPPERIRPWRAGQPSPLPGIRIIESPGHLPHHISFLDEATGTLYAGDSLGIVLEPGAPVHTPTPPPGTDLDAWRATLTAVEDLDVDRAAIQHFGVHEDVGRLAGELREALDAVESSARRALSADGAALAGARAAFEELTRGALARHRSRDAVDGYFDIFRAANDFDGVVRWVSRGGSDES